MKNIAVSRRLQHGQAMTEFAIVAATVLVPLFLILPVLTKYSEAGQKSVEMARYAVWERSVWHEAGSIGVPAGALATGLPQKPASEIEDETRERFMAPDNAPILSQAGNQGLDPFFHDMNGNALVSVAEIEVHMPGPSRTPGWGYFFLGEVLDGVQSLYKAVSFLGSNSTNFSPDTNGYYKPDSPLVRIPLRNVKYVVPEDQKADLSESIETIPLSMEADAALLVDTWSAQGPTMFKTQTGGLVPSSLLNNGLFNVLRDIASTVLLEPKLAQPAPGKSNGWDMGGYSTDAFNIETSDEDLCDDNGVCSFTGDIHGDGAQYDL